ncbi:hypothetical protein JCM10212_006441 [Sporobolomyces blumeae]
MPSTREPETIQFGDWIIIYSNRTQVSSDVVTRDKEIQTRYGHFRHNSMVGQRWGIKFPSSNQKGFVYLLKPTPELWTLALPHRTQILYLPDIAFITSYLNVRPGSSVIEAGTGSGSFSHSLVRSVGGTGKVHSFEYHEERFGKARDEFALHKLDHIIKIKHQNVYKDGFELENEVDAVFLDLPAPWEALEHAKKAMRKDRPARICCFSPCIEQVIRTCTSLSDLGFSDITMYETLTRTHDPVPLIPVLKPVSTVIERLHEVEVKKERRREIQIEDAKRRRDEREKRKREEGADEGSGKAGPRKEVDDADDADDDAHKEKKVKLDRGEEETNVEERDDEAPSSATTTRPSTPNPASTGSSTRAAPVPAAKVEKEFVLKPGPYSRGHTSFLTFAVLLPVEDKARPKDGSAESVAAGREADVVEKAGSDKPMETV